ESIAATAGERDTYIFEEQLRAIAHGDIGNTNHGNSSKFTGNDGRAARWHRTHTDAVMRRESLFIGASPQGRRSSRFAVLEIPDFCVEQLAHRALLQKARRAE